jgi:hypothetical protein
MRSAAFLRSPPAFYLFVSHHGRSTVDAASGEVKFVATTFVGTSSYQVRSVAACYCGLDSLRHLQPPELKEGGASYDPAAFDVWSLGVILFFLVVRVVCGAVRLCG